MMGGYGSGYGNMMGGGWFGLLGMLFFGLLVLAGIVALVIWALRSSHGGAGSASAPPSAAAHDEAVALARRRLASGEITKEEYDAIMSSLSP